MKSKRIGNANRDTLMEIEKKKRKKVGKAGNKNLSAEEDGKVKQETKSKMELAEI